MKCQICHRKMSPKEPSYRHTFWRREHPTLLGYACAKCAEKAGLRFGESAPCIQCGRKVFTPGAMYSIGQRLIVEADPRLLAICSPECEYALQLERSKLRRRVKPQAAECAECGKLYTPKRKDGRFCSGACRQKAHRGRQSSSHRRVTAPMISAARGSAH
jgi:hypothetical protein